MKSRKLEGPELLPLLLASALESSFVWSESRHTAAFGAQGALLAEIIAFPLLWALLTFYGRKVSVHRPHWFSYALIAVLLLSAAMELAKYQRFYTQVLGSHLPVFWFLALALAVAAYGQAMSEGALGRAAQFVLAFLAVSTILLLLAATDQMRVESLNCRPLAECGMEAAFFMRMLLMPEFLLLPVIRARATSRAGAGEKAFFLPAVLFVVDGLLLLSLELIFGSGWQDQCQPVYTLARLGTLSVFRRMDALHLAIWTMLFFLRIALYFWAIAHLAQDASRQHRRTQVFSLSAFIVLILFALALRLPWSAIEIVRQALLWLLLLAPLFWKGEALR